MNSKYLLNIFTFIFLTSVFIVALNCGGGSGSVTTTSTSTGTTTGSATTDSYDRNALLKSLAENVIVPIYENLATATANLKLNVEAYNVAVQNSTSDKSTKLTSAQNAWKATMLICQEAELLQFGPAGSSTSVKGGQGIRDEIYSWPSVNTCRVDQEVVENVFSNSSFFSNELVNSYGLDVLEYLLFNTNTTNSCSTAININTNGSWSALSSTDVEQRRAAYASVVAGNISDQATSISNNWKNSFSTNFSGAGNGAVYASAQEALNDVMTGLFYIDTKVKDDKLVGPLGINSGGTVDVEVRESKYANHSVENILANLKAFRKLFLGNDPSASAATGFDDFLNELGQSTLSATMKTDIDSAITAAESFTATLNSTLISDSTKVQDLYNKVKVITDNLKGDFATTLSLTIPSEGSGDND
jgi:uncharacterized protein